MIAERPRASLRASATSSARCTKESAIQATPSDIAYSRSARSFSVIEPKGSTVSGRLMPLRLPSNPLVITSASILTSLASTTRSLSLPSSSKSVWPGLTAWKISGCGRCTRPKPPIASRRTKLSMSPSVSLMAPESNLPMRSLGPCRSTRMPIGRENSTSSLRTVAWMSRKPSCVAWLIFTRNTSAPASNRRRIVSSLLEAGPSVATILTRRFRLIATSLRPQDR